MNSERLSTQDKAIKGFVSVSIGTLGAAVICTILLVISALLFTKGKVIPYAIISQFVMLISAIATFFGGFLTAKVAKTKGLALGAITGLAMFIIVAICSVLVFDEPFTSTALLRALLLVISAALGGVIGINKKKKRRR